MATRKTQIIRPETTIPLQTSAPLKDRLSRIEGHIRGIKKMIDDSRRPDEILTQIAGVKAAIGRVSLKLVEYELETCVNQAIKAGHATDAITQHKKNLSLICE